MNIEAFLERGPPRTYKEWKQTRATLIRKLRDVLILSSESELRATFAKWESLAKQQNDPETEDTAVRKLTYVTLISHFQSYHDTMRPYRSFLAKCLRDDSMLIVRVASKVMQFMSRESMEGNCIFAKSVQKAQCALQSRCPEKGLVILARARFAVPSRVMNVILTCVDRMYELGISGNKGERKMACKLLKFGLERSESVMWKDMAHQLLALCLGNFHESVNILNVIASTSLDLLGLEFVVMVRDLVVTQKDRSLPLCELALAVCKRKRNRVIIGSELLNILVEEDYFQLVKQALLVFDEKTWDLEKLSGYLEKKMKDHKCDNETENCPMTLLLLVIKKFRDLEIDTSEFEICDHFIECLQVRPTLLPEKWRKYYEDLNDLTQMSPEKIRHALAIWRICFGKLVLDPDQVRIDYDQFVNDPTLRIEFMKNAVADGSSSAQEVLLTSALFDVDESVRQFCVDGMQPTVNLAFEDRVFWLLNDASGRVRRRSIKLISKLNRYNPLLVTERVLTCMRNHISILERTEAIYTAANLSFTLPAFSKYFLDEMKPYVGKIINIILTLVDPRQSLQLVDMGIGLPSQDPPSVSQLAVELPNTTASFGGSVRQSQSIDVFPLSFDMAVEATSADGSGGKEGKSNPKRGVSYSPSMEGIIHPLLERPEEIVTKARNIVHTQQDQQKETEPNKMRIRQLFSAEKIDKRDACLCKTIVRFGMLAEPWLTPILNMFCYLLETKKDEQILISIVKSLRQLSQKIYNGLNIRLRCPQLITPLTNLIMHSRNRKLSVCIIKLFGSSFDTLDVSIASKSQMNPEAIFSSTTDHLFESMFNCFPAMSLPHFAAIAMMFESDPTSSAKYVSKVVPIFMKAIRRAHNFRKTLFSYLTTIASHCKVEFEPLLPVLVPELLPFFDEVSCVKFLTALSFYLKQSFQWVARELYVPGLRKLVTRDEKYFGAMVKFLCFSIVFQNQPFDIFLEAVEQNYLNAKQIAIVFRHLRLVVQTVDLPMMQTRIFHMTRKYFDPQLLFSLVVYLHLPASQLRSRFTIVDCDDFEMEKPRPDQLVLNAWSRGKRHTELSNESTSGKPALPRNVYEQLCNPPKNPESLSFLEIETPRVKTRTLLKPFAKATGPYFAKFTCPSEVNCSKWTMSLFESVAKKAPSSPIRACISMFSYSEKFANILGIMGFANCWAATTQEDRDYFSAIIRQILNEHHVIDNEIFEIIEVCERVGIPMQLDYLSVVRKCPSHYLSLYCLEKYLKSDSSSVVAFDLLMNLFLKMGYINTTNGTFETKKRLMDKMMIAKWSANLGNWKEALRIYESEKGEFSSIVNCYAKMGAYDKLYAMKDVYATLSTEERDAVNDGFFLAFVAHGDVDTAKEIIHSFAGKWSPYRFLLAVNFFIDQGEYVKAQKLINRAFEFLATNRHVFSCGDQSEITKVLNEAQLFIDCQEILNVKKMKTDMIWKQRVKGFRRDTMMWREIIVMKNKIVPISSNIEFYSKVISVLRKDGQFELIDTYFKRALEENSEFLALIKIGWARNEKDKVCQLCRCLEDNLSSKSMRSLVDCIPFCNLSAFLRSGHLTEEANQYIFTHTKAHSLGECLNNLYVMSRYEQQAVLQGFALSFPDLSEELVVRKCDEILKNRRFLSRFYRIASRIIFSASSSLDDTLECQRMLLSGLEIDQNDFRLWKQWGYINVRLYSIVSASSAAASPDTMKIRPRKSPKKSEFPVVCDRPALKNSTTPLRRRVKLRNPLAKSCHSFTPDPGNSSRRKATKSELEMSQDVFAVNAITGFLKATLLRSSDSLEFLCQLLGVLFSLKKSEHIPKSVYTEIQSLPSSVLVSVIPQLTAHISYGDDDIRKLVHSLVMNVAVDHFQEMFFPLLLYSKFEDNQAIMAQELLKKLQVKDPEKYADAWLFTDGMIRSAVTWIESWIHVIDLAAKLHKLEDHIGFRKLLTKQFEESQNEWCELDRVLIAMYKDHVADLYESFRSRDKCLVTKLVAFGRNLKLRADKLSLIVLTKISEPLASRRGLSLSVPGIPDGPLIENVEPAMEILPTQQRPRIVYIKANTGVKIKYLLKGNEDLRLDERFMQFFKLVNQCFMSYRHTRDVGLSISRYAVIPITVNAGLIQWVTGADTLYQIVSDNRKFRKRSERIEHEIITEFSKAEFINFNSLQKLEVFEIVRDRQPANELFEWMWINSPNAQSWMCQNERYTKSLATMSMVGYIIGLGDRHPGNIMIQKSTGDVIHIDFGESFESASLRENFPEHVPFRLTRLLVNNVCGCDSMGYFRMMAQFAMTCLRRNITSLIGQLSIFIHDPLKHEESQDTSKVDRVESKLHGTEFAEDTHALSVADHVDILIHEAENPVNYVRHYPGWCPFW